jgi:cytochrome P450
MTSIDAPMVLDDEFFHDPHSFYRQLRTEAPVRDVVLPRGLKVWMVTRYADVRDALANPALRKDLRQAQHLFDRHQTRVDGAGDIGQDLTAHMLNSDPPDHTRLRKLVAKAFTMRRVELLRPRVEEITDTLLAGLSGEVDLVKEFAFPLPVTVICELLGVPHVDRDTFGEWSATLLSLSSAEAVDTASKAMVAYLQDLIAAKRAAPAEDMMSALIQATDDGDGLSELELVSTAFLLLLAGHETTMNLISNGVLALLRNPDQLAALIADPDLLPGAIEELLRYTSPVNHSTLRYTTEPTKVGDTTIPADEFVAIALTAANRDESRFPAADTLDVTRPAGGHMALGHGIHFCLGAPLARLEGQTAIGRLIDRFPNMTLNTDIENLTYRGSTLIHSLERLPIRVD